MNTESVLAPTDLRDFLTAQGWEVCPEGLPDRMYVLGNPRFARRQLAFPMDVNAPDYAESVRHAIDKLAELVGKSRDAIYTHARSIKDDVIRFRLADFANETALPLDFAATVIHGTEQLLKAAACTVLRPRTHHPRLSLTEATQLVEKARFGHTEPGSFIFKVACPINAMEVQGNLTLEGENTPFVRQVTIALQRGLLQLTDAIETGRLDDFVDALKRSETPLVSSNLCEAIAEMHDESIGNSLDVSINWSLLHAVSPDVQRRSVMRIQHDYFSRIEEVRRELKSVETHRDDTFVGTVERLDGDMGEDGRRSGEVILALLLPDGESIRVRTTLDAVNYERADQAHMTNGAYIQVSGRLHPGRQPRQFTNVSRFELLQ